MALCAKPALSGWAAVPTSPCWAARGAVSYATKPVGLTGTDTCMERHTESA